MGRIAQQKNVKQGPGPATAAVRGAKVAKQRKKHKLVFESTSNKDDEDSGVVLSFHTDPPPGYTFIPAGNTQLTAAMKAFAKRGQHKIMAVSATPHATRHELSREVHRVGYHFPTPIVDQVCSHYGIRLDSSGRLIGENDSEKLFMKISQKGQVVLNEKIRDQVTINTEAKEIIRDLFPKIPDNDLFQIIKTAFQLGDNKVGTADEIPLVRRAQLSVVAHIRHNYTNYDKLLRQVPYNEARHMVEKATLKRLVEWRGDDKAQDADSKRAVDEAVREVVVLSDEDDSESELEEGQVIEGKSDAMEVDSTRKVAPRVVATEHRAVSPGEMSSEEEPPRGYRYVPQPSRQRLVVPSRSDAQARQQSRYAIWDQVRQEHWAMPSYENTSTVVTRIPIVDPHPPQANPIYAPTYQAGREVAHMSQRPTSYVLDEQPPVRVIRERSPTTIFRGPDGRLFEKISHSTNGTYSPHRVYTPPTRPVAPSYPSQTRRSASPRPDRPRYHRRTPSMNDDGTILQSIERPESTHVSPAVHQKPFEPEPRRVYLERAGPSRHTGNFVPLIDLTDSAEQANRRMRPSTPPSPWLTRPRQDQYSPDETINADRRRGLIDLSPRAPPDTQRVGRLEDGRLAYLEPEDRVHWMEPRANHPYEDYRIEARHRPVQTEYAMADNFRDTRSYPVQDTRARHEPLDRHNPILQEALPARGLRDQNTVYVNPYDHSSQVSVVHRDMMQPTRMELDYQPHQNTSQYTTQSQYQQGHPSSRYAYIRQ